VFCQVLQLLELTGNKFTIVVSITIVLIAPDLRWSETY
jgi:hypothetical protein